LQRAIVSCQLSSETCLSAYNRIPAIPLDNFDHH
jgi:hypothetical protein